MGLPECIVVLILTTVCATRHFDYPVFLNEKTIPYLINDSALPVLPAIGESYAGLLPIDSSTDKELFFWFVPQTTSSPQPSYGAPNPKKQILIWFNGGPGCSSLMGFLWENGPLLWKPGTMNPTYNPYSWTNVTNVVWIEQPVGVGYSSGTPNATDEHDVAEQFNGFWKNFLDLFDLHDYDIILGGQSYAGLYVPFIASHMSDRAHSTDKSYFNVVATLLIDPVLGPDAAFAGDRHQIMTVTSAVSFIDFYHGIFPFNASFNSKIHNQSRACGYDEFNTKGLTFPPLEPLPPGPTPARLPHGMWDMSCNILEEIYAAIAELNQCFNPDNIAQPCPVLDDCLSTSQTNHEMPYFNRIDVKRALHVPTSRVWHVCSQNPVFVNGTDHSLVLDPPVLHQIPKYLESGRPLVIISGCLDFTLTSNGTLMQLNNMTWGGVQGFSEFPSKDLVVSKKGTVGRYVSERGLTFVNLYLAGHAVPMIEPEAVFHVLEWLDGGATGEL